MDIQRTLLSRMARLAVVFEVDVPVAVAEELPEPVVEVAHGVEADTPPQSKV